MTEPSRIGLRHAVMRGGMLLSVRSAIGICVSLVGVLVTTRIIGPASYGTYVAAISIHLYTLSLGQAGIAAYLIRGLRELDDRDFEVASTFLFVFGCVGGLIEAFGLARIGLLKDLGDAGPVLALLACSLPLQMMTTPASARLDRDLNFRGIAFAEVTSQTSFVLVAVPLALLGWGAWSLASGWVVQQLLACVLYHRLARWLPRPRWDWPALKKMLDYATSYSIAQWAWQIRSLVNPIVVGSLLGVEAVGIVNIAIRIVELLSFAKNIGWRLSISALARLQDDKGKMIAILAEGMELQMLTVGPLLVVFAVAGPEIIGHVFGARWLPALEVYPYIALGYLINCLYLLPASALLVFKRTWDVAIFNIVHVVLFVVSAHFLVRAFGIEGYGFAELAAFPSYAILAVRVRRVIGPVSYRIALPWCLTMGATLLLAPTTGPWIIVLPLATLAWPSTWERLTGYLRLLRSPRPAG